MEPSTHSVLIYDTTENKRDVLFSHLKYGQTDSKLVYVCSEESPESIREGMKSEGIDVSGLEAINRLAVHTYDQVYIKKDGSVNIPEIIQGFADLALASKQQGMRGIRAAAEMSCFFRRGKVPQLVEYERALGKGFYFPGMGVCAYNVLEMQSAGCLDVLMPLLRAHGNVILTGPKGAVSLPAERVQQRQVERTLEIRIPAR